MTFLHRLCSRKLLIVLSSFLIASAVFSQDWLKILNTAGDILKWSKVAYVILASDDELELYLNRQVNAKVANGRQLYQSDWLTNIGKELVRNAAGNLLPPGMKYEFFIIGSSDYNAFAVPGGTIYITTPLYELLDRDEVAFVLGHEIGHVVKKHGIISAKRNNSFIALKEIGKEALKKDRRTEERLDALVSSTYLLVQAGYSREWERDVDNYSAILCNNSGFDPKGGIRALRKLGNATKSWGQACFLWNSHPSIEERFSLISNAVEVLSTRVEPENKNQSSINSNSSPVADFSAFPDGTVNSNCTQIKGLGWDNNPHYKSSIRLLAEGAKLEFTFFIENFQTTAIFSIEHLSSLSGQCPDGGYSPVTISINENIVAKSYSPKSHSMTTEYWDVSKILKNGNNKLIIEANELCSHYWLRKWFINL